MCVFSERAATASSRCGWRILAPRASTTRCCPGVLLTNDDVAAVFLSNSPATHKHKHLDSATTDHARWFLYLASATCILHISTFLFLKRIALTAGIFNPLSLLHLPNPLHPRRLPLPPTRQPQLQPIASSASSRHHTNYGPSFRGEVERRAGEEEDEALANGVDDFGRREDEDSAALCAIVSFANPGGASHALSCSTDPPIRASRHFGRTPRS